MKRGIAPESNSFISRHLLNRCSRVLANRQEGCEISAIGRQVHPLDLSSCGESIGCQLNLLSENFGVTPGTRRQATVPSDCNPVSTVRTTHTHSPMHACVPHRAHQHPLLAMVTVPVPRKSPRTAPEVRSVTIHSAVCKVEDDSERKVDNKIKFFSK